MPSKKTQRKMKENPNKKFSKRQAPQGKLITDADRRQAAIGRALGSTSKGKNGKKPGKKDQKNTKKQMNKTMADFLCGGRTATNLNSIGLDALRVATADGEFLDFRSDPERLREAVRNQMINGDSCVAFGNSHQHLDPQHIKEVMFPVEDEEDYDELKQMLPPPPRDEGYTTYRLPVIQKYYKNFLDDDTTD